MSQHPTSFLVVAALLLALVFVQAAKAEKQDQKGKPVHTDLYGDPLPKGAITRIGTVRLLHEGEVRSVVFSPDGKNLASAGADRFIRIWETATGKELLRLEGHRGSVSCLAYSPDGKALASAAEGGEVLLWEATNGTLLERLFIDSSYNSLSASVAFSSNGKTVIAASGITVVSWDVATGHELKRIDGRPASDSTTISSDGKTVMFLSRGSIHLCDLSAPEKTETISVPRDEGSAAQLDSNKEKESSENDGRSLVGSAFSADGNLIAATSRDGSVFVWNVKTKKETRRFDRVLVGAYNIAFAPDGRTVVAAESRNDQIVFCDLTTGKHHFLNQAPKQPGFYAIAFSPDGNFLATGGENHQIRVLDLKKGMETPHLESSESGPLTVRLSLNGKTLATLKTDSTDGIRLWDSATGKFRRRLGSRKNWLSYVAVSPDGKTVAAICKYEGLLLWDTETGIPRSLGNTENGYVFVEFSPDSKTLAAGGNDKITHLWNLATGKECGRLTGHEGKVASAAFAPDGLTLATSSDDRTVRLWDVADSKEMQRLEDFRAKFVNVAFAPDGNTLAASGDDGCMVIWQGKPFRRFRRIPTDRPIGSFVHFSPDGKTLAACKNNHALGLWEVASGKLQLEIPGQSNWSGSAAFFPNGKSLVVGGSHGSALVWDLEALRNSSVELKEKPGRTGLADEGLPPGAVARLGAIYMHYETAWPGPAFSPDNKTLVLASNTDEDHSLRIWDVATRKEIRRLAMEEGLYQVAFSPDGRLLVAASSEIVYLWDPATGEKLNQFRGTPEGVGCFLLSPDGKTLIVGSGDNGDRRNRSILFWDLKSGRVVRRFDEVPGPVEALAISTDGKALVSHCALRNYNGETGPGWSRLPGGIFVWDVESGKLVRRLKASGDGAHISADGKTVAIVEAPDTISVWDVESDKLHFQRKGQHIQLAFAPDGRMLAMSAQNQPLRLLAIPTGKEQRTFEGEVERASDVVCFSSDGKTLVGNHGLYILEGTLHLWDVATGKEVPAPGGHSDVVTCLAVAPDGGTVVSGSRDTTLRVWDKVSCKELRRFEGHKKGITAVALSPDSKIVASGDADGTVRLWRADTCAELNFQAPHSSAIRTLSFSADGKLLVVVGENGKICTWEISTGKELNRQDGHHLWRSCISLSPNGKTVVCGGSEGEVLVHEVGFLRSWDLATGKELWKLQGEENEAYSAIAFSPDGKLIAVCRFLRDAFRHRFYGQQVCLREAATGKIIWRKKMKENAEVIAFTPDSRVLVSGVSEPLRAADRNASLWDVATGMEFGHLAGHMCGINALAFFPNGRHIATGSADHSVLIWDATWPGIPLPPQRVAPFPAKVEQLWQNLLSTDASIAHRAAWSMVFTPKTTLPFLRDQLRPVEPADKRLLARMIADLDSDEFDVREKAMRALEDQGELAENALRTALKTEPSEEAKRRTVLLLDRIDSAIPLPRDQRIMRATAVLERVGTVEARKLLKDLSEGAPDACLTKQADSALQRLNRRLNYKP